MKFKIHNEHYTDHVILEGKTIEEIRQKLDVLIDRRPDFKNGSSEELE